jgi:hypothetical protein
MPVSPFFCSSRHPGSSFAATLMVSVSLSLALLKGLSPVASLAQEQPQVSPTATAGAVSAPEYQAGLQAIYEAWRSAMQRKDHAAWKATTASYRQMEIRNRIVSQKQSFPEAMFAVPMDAPQLAQLSLIDIFVNGPTASAIYFGKLSFGSGQTAAANVPDSFLVLRFAGEGDAWKFDNMRIIKFGSDSGLLFKISQGDFSFLQSLEFQPSGTVPPVAKPVGNPDFLAELWVSAIGYQATVEVNGQHQSEVVNNTGRDLVNGGLRRGDNRITITVKPDPKADPNIPKRVEVGIYASPKEGQPAERVYHFRADPEAVPPFHSDTVRLQ